MNIISYQNVKNKIVHLRGQEVILDFAVAELYGVETMRVNEAVKNNPKKFPEGYILELTKEEKAEVIEIFDNPKLKFSTVLPKAFTEKGLYMLATILKGDKATETTIAIHRSLRETAGAVKDNRRAIGQSRQVRPEVTDAEKRGDNGRPVRRGYANR